MCRTSAEGGAHMCSTSAEGGAHMCRISAEGGAHMCRTSAEGGAHICRTSAEGGAHMHLVHLYVNTYTRMSSALNRRSALEWFECGNAIEIRNGIMFDFYPGLPHLYLSIVYTHYQYMQCVAAVVFWQ